MRDAEWIPLVVEVIRLIVEIVRHGGLPAVCFDDATPGRAFLSGVASFSETLDFTETMDSQY